jgi:hypothetical protein
MGRQTSKTTTLGKYSINKLKKLPVPIFIIFDEKDYNMRGSV